MDAIKIRYFEEENPGKEFPWFHSADESNTRQLRDALAIAFDAPAALTPLELCTFLNSRMHDVDEVNAESCGFELRDVLRRLGISALPEIFINWYRFDDIDRMKLDDLADCFQSIWYPSSDDIDVFDSTLSWIVSVTHYGSVRAIY
ncbi:MAG: hypothetical protein ABFC96_06425 [Thermoguttaceae bacterium]